MELGAQHPTKTLLLRTTSEIQEIVDIMAPVEDDAWRDIKIVIIYPWDSVKHPIEVPIEVQVKDANGISIDGDTDVTCGEGVVYSVSNSDRPGCMLTRDVPIDNTKPAQPIRVLVRSITGRDVTIAVTFTLGLGEKIRVREGPRLLHIGLR
jgi:hypothetical protein